MLYPYTLKLNFIFIILIDFHQTLKYFYTCCPFRLAFIPLPPPSPWKFVLNQVFKPIFIIMDDDNFSDVLSECSEISYFSDSDLDFDLESVNFDLSNGSPIDANNFNVVHFNINSITAEGRLDELTDVCRILNVSVLVLTETKLDKTIPDNQIRIRGYHDPIRCDRLENGRNGGGVLVYIAEHLIFEQIKEFQSEFFEHLWVDLKVCNKTITLNALYRPPNNDAVSMNLYLETVQNMLEKLADYSRSSLKLVIGDQNFGNCYCKSAVLSPKPLDSAASDLFSSFGFKQLINIPTRVTENTSSLVDLIFVDNMNDIACHGTLPQIADHDGVVTSFKFQTDKPKSKSKIIYDYKNADVEGLTQFIKNFNFEDNVFCDPIESQAEIFTQILSDALDRFVPKKTITLRETDAPWCNSFTRLLLRKKNRNYLFYKKCDLDYRNGLNDPNISSETITKLLTKRNKAWEKSREAANNSSKFNRRAKLDFYNNVNCTMRNFSISPKKKFDILLRLMKNSKFSAIPPLVENEVPIQDSLTKSNLLNSFFASKANVHCPDDPVPSLDKFLGISCLEYVNTSPIEVAKLIRDMKKSRFSHCGISGVFLSLISKEISTSMTKLFNNLFENGHFPSLWKISHVTPIYKRSGSKSLKENFRPISILPTISKIFESIMHERLIEHCTRHNIISEKQAAYLKGDSTIHQLLYIVHKIRTNWAKNKLTHGIFLDVSSAFDKVWHAGLIAKLEQIGLGGIYLETLKSYLSERKQVVVVDGSISDILSVNAGIPQGSRLGPLLFIIYMNDIINDIESDIIIFADDTSLFASGFDPNETAEILNRDLLKNQ